MIAPDMRLAIRHLGELSGTLTDERAIVLGYNLVQRVAREITAGRDPNSVLRHCELSLRALASNAAPQRHAPVGTPMHELLQEF